MFYGRFAVEGDNPMDNPNRKNEKVDIGFSAHDAFLE